MIREIEVLTLCIQFFENQEERVAMKFLYLLEILGTIKIVHSHFIKKVKGSPFYELRITANNAYRVIVFPLDHFNFSECTRAICLHAFIKRTNKDYSKAITQSKKLLDEYLKN